MGSTSEEDLIGTRTGTLDEIGHPVVVCTTFVYKLSVDSSPDRKSDTFFGTLVVHLLDSNGRLLRCTSSWSLTS